MKIKEKNIFWKIWSVITTFLVILLAFLAVFLSGIRLFGYTPYTVLSGSMIPEYYPGDLVYVRKVLPEDIYPGDVITFKADGDSTIVTHRVVRKDSQNESFVTKGDANDAEDGKPVPYENVLGEVRFSLPKLGYVSGFFFTPAGRCAGIVVLLFIILLAILPGIFKKEKKNK